MGFTLYPQPAVRSLVVAKGGARVDTDFLQRAGTPLPEFAGIYAQMMFLRVAMIAGDAAAPPTLFLTAGNGPSVEIGTDPRSVSRATGGAGTGVVGDVFLVAGPGNTFQVMVGFEELTSEAWKLGIRNNDPAADLDFTWVVADNAGETNQPWVDVRRFGYHTAAVVAVKQPRGIAVDAALHSTYVAVVDFDGQHTSHDVSVIDTVTHSIIGTLTAGLFPWAVAVDQATHEVYVTNCADATASVIDGRTRSLIATIPVGKNTSSVDVDTRTRAAYVGNGNDNTVSVIDANTRTVVATIPVDVYPGGVCVDAEGHTAYVSNVTKNTVTLIDTTTRSVAATLVVGNAPFGLALDARSRTIYVADGGANAVSAIDARTRTVAPAIAVGSSPQTVAVDAGINAVYVANSGDNTLSVIDSRTRSVTQTIPVGKNPLTMAVNPDSHMVYVGNFGDKTVTVIEAQSP